MRSNCVAAIATSSLLVRSCKLLCSCRDAAHRRCHEFRPDWIGDRFAQDPVDLSLDGRSPSWQSQQMKRIVGLRKDLLVQAKLNRRMTAAMKLTLKERLLACSHVAAHNEPSHQCEGHTCERFKFLSYCRSRQQRSTLALEACAAQKGESPILLMTSEFGYFNRITHARLAFSHEMSAILPHREITPQRPDSSNLRMAESNSAALPRRTPLKPLSRRKFHFPRRGNARSSPRLFEAIVPST
jgi:hypothetical protein